jgi:DNA-binding NtrC family response regulator
MNGRVLIVEDDAAVREAFRLAVERAGYAATTAESGERALTLIDECVPDLVLTDVRMERVSGLDLLERVREAQPDVDIVVITGLDDMETAVAAMKAGAYDFLVKPLDAAQIRHVVERCFRDRAVRRRLRHLTREASEPYSLARLVGRSPRMIEIYKLIGALAHTRTPVLIRGETGTGKEVIARAIHFNSVDAEEPFVAVNCTALPPTLLESELFGHVRGSFTGADRDRKGRFELAGSGTIFLDEIGDTTPDFQAKLLRVVQHREYYPVGGDRPRSTHARVIAATHRPIEDLVRQGRFREDLYYRLKVVEINVPPLRERPGDIPLLVRHLLRKICEEMHQEVRIVPDDVMAALVAHDWPGNVRELENALTRAAVLARGPTIRLEDLALGQGPSAHDADAPALQDDSLAAAERAHIERILRRTGGNKRQAARLLRISRSRLDRLLKKYELL